MGHSTLSAEAFAELLRAHEVEAVAYVRWYPGSRRHPQFNQATLAGSLAEAGIEYRHFVDLGGGSRRSSIPRQMAAGGRPRSRPMPTTC